ncbi:MAG: serine hydrolase, partial [Elusimicrobia bacterium]|nr:serine hydrolase [Elusimicrobiota bacterium]
GGSGEHSSMLYTVPDQKLSVAVVGSGPKSGAMQIALDILDAALAERKLVGKEEQPVPAPVPPRSWPKAEEAYAGYYANENQLFQAVFDAGRRSLTVNAFQGQEKSPARSLVYNDGYYHDPKGERSYFISVGGEDYFVDHMGSMWLDRIAMQKLQPLAEPRSLRIPMDGRRWLRRNVSPREAFTSVGSHFVRSYLYKDLPGYVYFGNALRIDGPSTAGMPFDAVRDQMELSLFEKDGATWAWLSSLLFSPGEAAAALKTGENGAKIGGEGFSEWLSAGAGLVLSFQKPKGSRVIVFSPEDEATYDSAADSGEAFVAKGGFVEFAGSVGDELTVQARAVGAGL